MNPIQIQATELLAKAGISSPTTRLMCETVINSNNESAVTELIAGLNEMIAEKEAAYQEFKTKMAQMAKEMLPSPAPTTNYLAPTTPPKEPMVDITPPGTTPTL